MKKLKRMIALMVYFSSLAVINIADAGEVKILAAELSQSHDNSWFVKVTLEHGDTGWDHYADNWQVVDGEGNVLGNRILQHPHVNEQPFTRNLTGVTVPEGVTTLFIKAHDKVHGWASSQLKVDLTKAIDGHLSVDAKQ